MFHFFFFNDTATTEIYTLSLHDALPIFSNFPWSAGISRRNSGTCAPFRTRTCGHGFENSRRSGCRKALRNRSEEHTSELQSRLHLVCRLLLETKNTICLTISAVLPRPHL